MIQRINQSTKAPHVVKARQVIKVTQVTEDTQTIEDTENLPKVESFHRSWRIGYRFYKDSRSLLGLVKFRW